MRMKLLGLAIVFSLLALSAPLAAASQNYRQAVGEGGASRISQVTDLTYYDAFSRTIAPAMVAACAKVPGTGVSCGSDATSLTLSGDFTGSDGYFTLTTDYGIPYVTYTLTVNKLPNDRFQGEMLKAAGESASASAALDLSDKESNANLAKTLKSLNLQMGYSVAMPGEITSASAGSYDAPVDGSTATFDLTAVLAGSAPLTVTSRALNPTAILGAAALIVVLLLAGVYMIMFRRAGPSAVRDEPPPAARPAQRAAKKGRARPG